MSVSKEQATDALKDAARIERRSAEAYGYRQFSPFLVLWGFVWAIGYGATDLIPQWSGTVWLGADIVGFAGSALIGRSIKTTESRPSWRFLASGLALAAFIAATIAIMPPVSGEQVGAFIPLLVALCYALAGIWTGPRILIAGILLAALTLTGFFFVHAHFALFMAAVGGGGLVLGGLWLKYD